MRMGTARMKEGKDTEEEEKRVNTDGRTADTKRRSSDGLTVARA